MKKRHKKTTLILPLVLVSPFLLLQAQEEKVFSREALIQDTRQLVRILESAHPDPYINGGGKIAFHRRFQERLQTILENGMTLKAFYRHLLPSVAAVGDGHTGIYPPQGQQPTRPGFPLRMDIIEKSLYVKSVFDEKHEPLFGAKLVSFEGVPFAELTHRQGELRGWDNEYHLLSQLSANLTSLDGLESLLPEWKNQGKIRVTLKLKNGDEEEFLFEIPEKMPSSPVRPTSRVVLPSVDKIDFAYEFMDEKNRRPSSASTECPATGKISSFSTPWGSIG